MKNKFKYIESYYDVSEIINFYNKINDAWTDNTFKIDKINYGVSGCWDVPLHLEIESNPVHGLIKKLREDFGNFYLNTGSLRYQAYPFLPHSDIQQDYAVLDFLKLKNAKKYMTFLIPLTWKEHVHPGTAFFSSPPELNEDLYRDRLDVLPHFSKEYENEMIRYSVSGIVDWKNSGDLVMWEDFVFHSTTDHHSYNFSKDPAQFCKSFLSIRVYLV